MCGQLNKTHFLLNSARQRSKMPAVAYAVAGILRPEGRHQPRAEAWPLAVRGRGGLAAVLILLFCCGLFQSGRHPLVEAHALRGGYLPVTLPDRSMNPSTDKNTAASISILIGSAPRLRPVYGVDNPFQSAYCCPSWDLRGRKCSHRRGNRPSLFTRQPPHKRGHFFQFCSHFCSFSPLYPTFSVGTIPHPQE